MAEQDDQTTDAQTTPETTEAEPREPQNVTVEDIGPGRKALTIEVPQERIAAKMEENFGRLRDEAVIPGFRRGRAPRRLIEKRFTDSIRDDVKASLLSESYSQAIEEEKIEVLGEPDVKDIEKIELPESGPLTFRVEIEVTPDVTLPNFEEIEVEKPATTVTDEDVQREVDQLCQRYGKLSEPADAKVKPEDYLQADVRILAGENAGDDAEEILHQPEGHIYAPGKVTDGRGQIAGILIKDLEKQITGKKVGEELRISMTGPESHENEKIKGQPITIVAKITKIDRVEPAKPAALAEQVGVADENELRQRIRENIEQRAQREQEAAMHKQVSDYLVEKVDLTLPEGITGRQAERILHRESMQMAYRGVPQEDIDQRIAEMRSETEEDARRQLKLFFILEKASRELEVEVSESELNGRITMLAMQQGRRPEKVRQEMHRNNELEYLYLSIREQKTLAKIVEKAKVKEVEAKADEAGEADEKKKDKPKSKGKKPKAE